MLIELVKIIKTGKDYTLKQIFVNPKHVVYLQEDENFKRKLKEGIISLDLHQSTGFSKLRLESNGMREELTVIGEPNLIIRKMDSVALRNQKQLLRD